MEPLNSHLLKSRIGVKRRLATLKLVLDGNSAIYEAVQKRESISLSAIVMNLAGKNGKVKEDHKRLLRLSSFSFAYRSYGDKINFSKIVSDKKTSKIIRYIAVGDLHIQPNDPLATTLTSPDYSLICRGEISPDYIGDVHLQGECFARFFRERGLKFSDIKTVLQSYASIGDFAYKDQRSASSITDIQDGMRHLTRKLWPITGSFAPHTIYRLCDPEEQFAREVYIQLSYESRSVLLTPLFEFITVFRAINGYNDAAAFADESYILQVVSKDRSLREKFALFMRGEHLRTLALSYKGRNNFSKILAITLDIYSMINIGVSLQKLYTEIARLFALDRQAILFLNWGVISTYIIRFPPGHSSLAIFVSILMTEPVIARRFPIQIGLRLGAGRANRQIFERASSLFRTRKANKITAFMRSFLDLKGEPRKHVFTYMADRAMSDRLYAIFITSTRRSAEHDEKRISQARIDILNFILDHQTSDNDVFLKFLDEETNLLRGLHFKEMYGKGRIHLDLFSLQIELEDIIFGEFNLGALRGKKKNILSTDIKFINHFSKILASRLVDHALLQSDYSVDAVLSNNLRHGVIEPKILSALDSACRGDTESACVDPVKVQVSQAVNRYMSDWLTLTDSGPTIQVLKQEIQDLIKDFIRTDKAHDDGEFAHQVVACVDKSLKNVVNQAEFAFRSQCVAEVKTIISEHFKISPPSIALSDRISTHLNNAFMEVESWLAVTDLRSTMLSFSVLDIAYFEVDLFLTDNISRKSSSIIVEKKESAISLYEKCQLTLDVEYFEAVYTIIHNLVSNAAKYSGYKHRTVLKLRIRSTGSHLTFQLRNNISSNVGRDVIAANQKSAQLAAKATNEHGAFKEGGSGYKKIRRICGRVFGGCTINIPPSPDPTQSFVVEVSVPYEDGYIL